MPYIKQVWVDRETPLDAEHLNHIEVGIYDAHDLIAGLESGKADVDHNHNGTYAPATHSHDYAPSSHNHDLLYSPLTHNHDDTYAAKSHSHDYAATNHNHEGVYSPVLHDHDERYSQLVHTHTRSEITDFPTIPTVPTISNNIAADAENTSKTTSPKAVKDYVDDAISSIGGGLEDLGAFPDDTALITHILTNNTPSGIYKMQLGGGHQIINIRNNSENVLVSILSEEVIAFVDFNKVSMEIEYFRTLNSYMFLEATQAQLVDGSVVDTMMISPKTFKDSVNALIANALDNLLGGEY
jgi:hypothetical protein